MTLKIHQGYWRWHNSTVKWTAKQRSCNLNSVLQQARPMYSCVIICCVSSVTRNLFVNTENIRRSTRRKGVENYTFTKFSNLASASCDVDLWPLDHKSWSFHPRQGQGRENATSAMWCWSGGINSIVNHYNRAHWYEQFLQVGRLLGLWSSLVLLSIFRAPLYLRHSWCCV